MSDNHDAEESGWHFTQETLLMLGVSVAQLQSILNDGGESVSELVESFVNLADTFNNLIAHKTDIDHTDLTDVKHRIEQGIIAFQFYDRMSQRLDHVSNSLQTMSHIIGDEERRNSPDQWRHFQDSIQRKLTMESERKIFQQILSGVPVEEALANLQVEKNKQPDDDIELF